MLKLLLRTGLLLALLAVMVSSALAQNTPKPVLDALNDLNRQLGTQFGIADVNYLWEEVLFNNEALGCDRLMTGNLTPKSIIGYRVQFLFSNNSRPTYDYRIAYTPSIFILCSPYTPPTPTPTPVPPTPIPSATVFVPAPQATAIPSATVYVPPAATPTPGSCPGLVSRLQIGIQARVVPGGANNLREQPAASTRFLGTIPAEGVFTVLDGPRCTGDGMWWQVNFNGTVGWTVEGKEGEYYVEPLSVVAPPTGLPTALPTMTPLPVICNAAIPPRLRIGGQGRVTPGGSANNVREQAGKSARLLGEIPPEGVFTVLDGPRCTGDGAWFQVNYNNLVGWTLEGMEAEYWLEPLGALEAINAATLPRTRALAPLLMTVPDYTSTLVGVFDRAIITHATALHSGQPFLNRWKPVDASASGSALAWTAEVYGAGAKDEALVYIPAQNQTLALNGGQVIVIETSKIIASVPGSTAPLTAAEFNATGTWLAIAHGTNITVMSTDPGSPMFQQPRDLGIIHAADVVDIAFSRDGTQMASLSLHQLVIWNTADWSVIATRPLESESVKRTGFSPDGRWIWVTLMEPEQASGTVLLWDKGNDTRRFTAPAGITYSDAVFTADGRYLITAGGTEPREGTTIVPQGYIDLWDIDTGHNLVLTSSAPQRFNAIMLNDAGTLMVTIDAASNVQPWTVQP